MLLIITWEMFAELNLISKDFLKIGISLFSLRIGFNEGSIT